MVVRQIIKIDEEKCNGCGICVDACHEGAIAMVDGKAKLIRDDYCDGLGDCLPTCPTGAISFETRKAAPFDEAAVKANMEAEKQAEPLPCGCPGTQSRMLSREAEPVNRGEAVQPSPISRLQQWPVQIKLVPVNAPYFNNANLLIAADCSAFAYGNFHNEFIKNRITLIGCPKLDSGDYAEKLTAIIKENNIKSVTVVRMEVPCCGGLEHAVKRALMDSEKMIPWQVVTISTDGEILE
ncbi:MAG TPA: 4Fe-4S binding protein [Anaerovoracaceae bacterium]|nr:4Fe-4S binding protein [Anaerovoracaceae bacterium]